MTYTCTKCGATEQQTIPMTVSIDTCDHSVEQEAIVDKGFTITFAGDSGVDSVTVYRTQDTAGASESVSATGTAVSRSSATGEPDSTGDGQVNFTVVLKDGYTLDTVSATDGTYKNIKDLSNNTYRITKINADTVITITTQKSETSSGYVLGDANGDGEVDLIDATVVQRACTMINVPYSEEQLMCADIDGDGTLSLVDATFIQRYCTSVSTPYNIGETVYNT